MRRLVSSFLGVALFVAGVSEVLRSSSSSPSQPTPSHQSAKVPTDKEQVSADRTWTGPPSERLWTAGTDETKPSFLLNASLVRSGHDGTVYVLDRGDLSVKIFDAEGEFLRSVAGTQGRGPGEFMNPTDFDVDDKGRVWIADPPNGRVSVYGTKGDFYRDISLKRRPFRIAVSDNGSAFYLMWLAPTEEALFARYDEDGTRLQEMDPVIENQVKRGMALDGWIALVPDWSLYYTTTRAGRLMRFDAGGTKTLDVETSDPAPIPEVIVDDRGGRRVDPSASIQSLGLQVVGPSVYIFSIVPDDEKADRAFDAYDRAGQYKHSIPLPAETSDAHFAPDRIYTITDTSLMAWAPPK